MRARDLPDAEAAVDGRPAEGSGRFVAMAAIAYVAYAGISFLSLLLGTDFIDSQIVSEEGVNQNLGALAFLAASVAFVVAFARSRAARASGRSRLRPVFYAIVALAFFLAAGEEASWGQHVFGYGTPEAIKEANSQGEFTLHNLKVFQENNPSSPYAISIYSLSPFHFFFFFGVVFLLAVPIACRSPRRRGGRLCRIVPLVPVLFGALFTGTYAVSRVLAGLTDAEMRQPLTEVHESALAVMFAIVGLWVVRHGPERRHT